MLGFGYHLGELLTLQKDSVWVELTELVALASGVFLPRAELGALVRLRGSRCM